MRSGSADDAVVTLDFDALDGGFVLPADADRVDPRDIDRMFISLVPPDYVAGSQALLGGAGAGAASTISDIALRRRGQRARDRRRGGAGAWAAHRDRL